MSVLGPHSALLSTPQSDIQMAKTVSDEEIQLRKRARRRLVGAIALVVAAIVVLPMLLDSKPEERSQEIDIQYPRKTPLKNWGSQVRRIALARWIRRLFKNHLVKHSRPRNRR